MAHILVVDDEHGIRDLLFEILDDEGHQVELAENAQQARNARLQRSPDLVLLDIWMPDTDGISLLKEWSSSGLLTMPVIVMSGHATIETAVEATRLGALSFLEKPITLQKLIQSVELGLKKSSDHAKSPVLPQVYESDGNLGIVKAVSMPLKEPHSVIQTLAPSSSCVLSLDQPLREAREQFDLAYFTYHLKIENGSVAKVAEKIGLERTHLYRKLKQLGIDTHRNKYSYGG